MKLLLRILILPLALVPCACNDRNNMREGARLKPLESAPGQPRLLATDTLPAGIVPREPTPFDPAPRPPMTIESLRLGRVRFDTYCAPCHARDAFGDGIIARHGFPQPPSLHDPAIRARPDEHYFLVITHGLGKMPPYAHMVPTRERWAVVDYVRALQLSQNAPPGAMAAAEEAAP